MKFTGLRCESDGIDEFEARKLWNLRLLDARVVEWTSLRREGRGIYDFWTRESWNCRLLDIEEIVGKSSANRRQIELGSVILKVTTTFG